MRIGRLEVMNSRRHASEDSLAELACAGLAGRRGVRVLIGGLGMGFTLAAALSQLGANRDAEVVVAELVPGVVHWNRGPLAAPAGAPLCDPRVEVRVQDVVELLKDERVGFDAIMLDVDNSPGSQIQRANRWLYTPGGLSTIRSALTPKGVVTVWSVGPERRFAKRLRAAGFAVEEKTIRARGAHGGARHHIWVARNDRASSGSRVARG